MGTMHLGKGKEKVSECVRTKLLMSASYREELSGDAVRERALTAEIYSPTVALLGRLPGVCLSWQTIHLDHHGGEKWLEEPVTAEKPADEERVSTATMPLQTVPS